MKTYLFLLYAYSNWLPAVLLPWSLVLARSHLKSCLTGRRTCPQSMQVPHYRNFWSLWTSRTSFWDICCWSQTSKDRGIFYQEALHVQNIQIIDTWWNDLHSDHESLKANNLCMNCLKPGHFVKQCKISPLLQEVPEISSYTTALWSQGEPSNIHTQLCSGIHPISCNNRTELQLLAHWCVVCWWMLQMVHLWKCESFSIVPLQPQLSQNIWHKASTWLAHIKVQSFQVLLACHRNLPFSQSLTSLSLVYIRLPHARSLLWLPSWFHVSHVTCNFNPFPLTWNGITCWTSSWLI